MQPAESRRRLHRPGGPKHVQTPPAGPQILWNARKRVTPHVVSLWRRIALWQMERCRRRCLRVVPGAKVRAARAASLFTTGESARLAQAFR